MSARLSLSALPAHSEPALSPSPSPTPELEREPEHEVDAVPASRSARKARSWVDPALLPPHAHPTPIGGSAPEWVKELNYNTLMHYGVGPQDAFGARVGRALRFVDVSVQRRGDGSVQRGGDGSVQRRGDGSVQRRENVSVQRRGSGERMEATTIAEVGVTKRAWFFISVPSHDHSCMYDPAVYAFFRPVLLTSSSRRTLFVPPYSLIMSHKARTHADGIDSIQIC